MGPSHIVQYANDALESLVAGPAGGTVIGDPLAKHLPADQASTLLALLDRVSATGVGEVSASPVDGESRPAGYMTLAAWPSIDEQGRRAGLIVQLGSVAPIAAELQDANFHLVMAGLAADRHTEQAERDVAHLRALLAGLDEGVVVLDRGWPHTADE